MLALKAYDLMRREGVRFVYAYHSENTFHSCKKLDWQLAFTMKGFLIKTNTVPIAKAVRKIGRLKSRYDDYVLGVLKSFETSQNDFENSNSDSGLYHIYNLDFFSYKCFTDNLISELESVKFWLNISSRISVGDVRFNSEKDLVNGIEALKKLANKLGLNEILFQTTPGTNLEQVLSKRYDGFESWKVGYCMFDKDMEMGEFRSNFGELDTF
jgi:hypothetical protein